MTRMRITRLKGLNIEVMDELPKLGRRKVVPTKIPPLRSIRVISAT